MTKNSKRPRRKAPRSNARRLVPRGDKGPSPFTYVPPNSRRVRLVWSGTKSMVEGAANNGVEYTYKLNGPYDVDNAVGSTSTVGFSEHAAFFTNYRVWNAAAKVICRCSGGSAGTLATVVMYPNATNTFNGSAYSWAVQPYAVKRTITSDTGGAGRNVGELTARYDLPSIARVTRQQFRTDMDYSSVTNTTPTRTIYLAIGGYGVGSSNVVAFTFEIFILMDVEFFNPIQLTA